MGRLLDALISGSQGFVPAIPAIPATPAIHSSCGAIANSHEDTNRGIAKIARVYPLELGSTSAADIHLLASIRELGFADAVLGRDDADPNELRQLSKAQLDAYAGALGRSAIMDAGQRPRDYTQPTVCSRCGPVWMWPGAPTLIAACPWCWRRKAGRVFARPTVLCGNCCDFKPNAINPAAGVGSCGLNVSYRKGERGRHPSNARTCPNYRPR